MAYGSVVVLEDVDLTVTAGEVVALTGVNGVGKSTLLSCLAGFRRPADGTVSVLGGPPRDNAEFWRSVAIVADQPTWYPGLTVRELLELVLMTHQPVRGWCLPADELVEIFRRMCDDNDFRVTDGVLSAVRRVVEAQPRDERFSNARFVRALFDDSVANLAVRLGGGGDREELVTLQAEDVGSSS